MNLIQRLRNLIDWSKLQAPTGYDFYTTKEGIIAKNLSAEEKPRRAQIIRMKDEKKIISELLEDK